MKLKQLLLIVILLALFAGCVKVPESNTPTQVNIKSDSTTVSPVTSIPTKPIENSIYEIVSAETIAADYDKIESVYKENPMQGDIKKAETHKKWMGKEIQVDGLVDQIPSGGEFIVLEQGRGQIICTFWGSTEWDDLINTKIGDQITVTGKIGNVGKNILQFYGHIISLNDCQIGTEFDRIQVPTMSTIPDKNSLQEPLQNKDYIHDGITFKYIDLQTISDDQQGEISSIPMGLFKSKWVGQYVVTTGTVHESNGICPSDCPWLQPISGQSREHTIRCGERGTGRGELFISEKTYTILGYSQNAGIENTESQDQRIILTLNPCHIIYESP